MSDLLTQATQTIEDLLSMVGHLESALEAAQAEGGEIVITRNDRGAIVAVTRQDAEGRILEVIAEVHNE